jgi:hypothetical protein
MECVISDVKRIRSINPADGKVSWAYMLSFARASRKKGNIRKGLMCIAQLEQSRGMRPCFPAGACAKLRESGNTLFDEGTQC